jgi:hypothetical protein
MLRRNKQISVWTLLSFCGIGIGIVYLAVGYLEKSWDEGIVGLIDVLLGFLLLPPLDTSWWFKWIAVFLVTCLSIMVAPF